MYFTQGAAFSLLSLVDGGLGDLGDCADASLLTSDINAEALQKYILHCAQQTDGGLRGEGWTGMSFICIALLACVATL